MIRVQPFTPPHGSPARQGGEEGRSVLRGSSLRPPRRWRGGAGFTRFRIVTFLGLALLGSAVIVQHHASAQVNRESKSDITALEKKLTEVLANQQLMLQKLDAMMEELRIIKVRATR